MDMFLAKELKKSEKYFLYCKYVISLRLQTRKMKGSELKRKITKADWYFVRHGGKHDLYGHDGHPGVLISIPRHESKEVPIGTAENILKITGLK